MRVLVCGGRHFADRGRLFTKLYEIKDVTLIIHGCCQIKGVMSGADKLAEDWAKSCDIPYIGVPAKWMLNGKAAGPIRNQEMIDNWSPDVCVAFPGGTGTADMVQRCAVAKIEVVEG